MIMERADIVNHLLALNKGTRYIEIGVADGLTFNAVSVSGAKVGVDPGSVAGTHLMTSDSYFEKCGPIEFDLIFIDGLHTQEQVARDLQNSFKHLSSNGYIVLHDMLPPNEAHEDPGLCGTCWRAIADLRCTDPHYHHITVDTDYGVGVARYDRTMESPLWEERPDQWDYNYLMKKRNDLMNVVSIERFRSLFQ